MSFGHKNTNTNVGWGVAVRCLGCPAFVAATVGFGRLPEESGADMARRRAGLEARPRRRVALDEPGEPHGLELSTVNTGMATWGEIPEVTIQAGTTGKWRRHDQPGWQRWEISQK